MENERKTIDCSKLRPGFGVTLPPGCLARLDPWLEAQGALDAALVGISNQEAARQDAEVLRAVVSGVGWTALTPEDREALRQ